MTDKLETTESTLFQAREKVLWKVLWDEIKSLRRQLAECQAREKVLRDVLKVYEDKKMIGILAAHVLHETKSDSAALDAMLKQAKRDALIEATERFNEGYWNDASDVITELRRLAKELK